MGAWVQHVRGENLKITPQQFKTLTHACTVHTILPVNELSAEALKTKCISKRLFRCNN